MYKYIQFLDSFIIQQTKIKKKNQKTKKAEAKTQKENRK